MFQIIKRQKNGDIGETISFSENPANVREEAIRRGRKAGYCASNGEPNERTKIMSRGFGESKLNIWPRDAKGKLID